MVTSRASPRATTSSSIKRTSAPNECALPSRASLRASDSVWLTISRRRIAVASSSSLSLLGRWGGRRASIYSQELFKSDNYADYLYFPGLSVEAAESLAELWHKRVREELGIAGADASELTKLFHQAYQGSRFSF